METRIKTDDIGDSFKNHLIECLKIYNTLNASVFDFRMDLIVPNGKIPVSLENVLQGLSDALNGNDFEIPEISDYIFDKESEIELLKEPMKDDTSYWED